MKKRAGIKKGRGIKRDTIIGIVVLVVAVVVIAIDFSTTGKTISTLTSGANYAPIDPHFNMYLNCVYLSYDDGWDITYKSSVRALDRKTGLTIDRADSCASNTKVIEYHCEDGYMKTRVAICPSRQTCKEGICG